MSDLRKVVERLKKKDETASKKDVSTSGTYHVGFKISVDLSDGSTETIVWEDDVTAPTEVDAWGIGEYFAKVQVEMQYMGEMRAAKFERLEQVTGC